MSYPNRHLYLTAHWVNAGVSGETGQCGIRFDSVTPASTALVAACATAWSTFWAAATAGINLEFRLMFLRLASLDVNGNYFPGTVAFDHTYGAPVAGNLPATVRHPMQVALASTFNTAIPRGQASKGRVYLPPIGSNLTSGYRFQSSECVSRSNAFAACLTSLNVALPGKATVFSRSTKSSTAGAKNVITSVMTGDRPDVQRRRAKSMIETVTTAANVT